MTFRGRKSEIGHNFEQNIQKNILFKIRFTKCFIENITIKKKSKNNKIIMYNSMKNSNSNSKNNIELKE